MQDWWDTTDRHDNIGSSSIHFYTTYNLVTRKLCFEVCGWFKEIFKYFDLGVSKVFFFKYPYTINYIIG